MAAPITAPAKPSKMNRSMARTRITVPASLRAANRIPVTAPSTAPNVAHSPPTISAYLPARESKDRRGAGKGGIGCGGTGSARACGGLVAPCKEERADEWVALWLMCWVVLPFPLPWSNAFSPKQRNEGNRPRRWCRSAVVPSCGNAIAFHAHPEIMA
jgi:hypothetical protein